MPSQQHDRQSQEKWLVSVTTWKDGERAGKVISERPEVTLAAYVSICFPVSPRGCWVLACLSTSSPCRLFSIISHLVSAGEKHSSKNGFPILKQITIMRTNVISLPFMVSTNFHIIKLQMPRERGTV